MIEKVFHFGATMSVLVLSLLFLRCSPAVQTRVERDHEPVPQKRQIGVLKPNMPVPKGSERIGRIEIGDTGLSTGCSFNQVIRLAKEEARKNGGHAIKLTRVKQPDMVSTCYRINAEMYRYETFDPNEDTRKVRFYESKIKSYLRNNEKLDPIEGVWNYSSKVKSKYSNNTTKRDNAYKIAILKRNLEEVRKFDAVIISSDVESWDRTGLVKATISSTAYSSLYEVEWVMANGVKESTDFKLKDEGFISASFDGRLNSVDARLIKQYPDIKQGGEDSKGNEKSVSGTGFVVSEKGFIVTNNHVVSKSESIEVIFPRDDKSVSYNAEVLVGNQKKDVSILEISDTSFAGFKDIPYGIRSEYSSGDGVFTLGYPMSTVMGESVKVTEGIISSTSGVKDSNLYLQTTVPVQPGNSGGPLFNMNGNVVGITTSTLNEEATGVDVENVNYSIKSEHILPILNLIPGYQRGANSKGVKDISLSDMVDNFKDYVCLVRVTRQ
jgi:S1-C subfamily serine protease